jgi:phosphoribosylamine--glycine ligase / phosphoribosylformylglycinamidine cyclo-ligase
VVFHAGTTVKDGKLLTSGGRVLAVSAYGATLRAALDSVYSAIQCIQFEQMVFRRDIAHQYALSTLL